jgi:hypothetical protein
MPKGMLFWVIFIIVLIFALFASWPIGWGSAWLVVFVLLGLLGWAVFGPPIQ